MPMQEFSEQIGAPPGTLIYYGRETNAPVKITLIQYNEQEVFEKSYDNIGDCLEHTHAGMVRWINVDGVHDTSIVEKVGKRFKIHPLTLEDIVNTNQRAKFEDYDHYVVCMMKMLLDNDDGTITAEQLTIVLLDDGTVVSFQEADGGDVFDIIRMRIRQGKGRIRRSAADYLAYALVDTVVDSYFGLLERIGDSVETIEDRLMHNPQREDLSALHQLKRDMLFVRKAVWPVREMVSNIDRSRTKLFSDETGIYLRDVYDHSIRVIDTVETYRDLLSGMMDLYLSSVSNKMNEVMKTLTIITTIFVPLTFVAGVYGMNFDNMPELHSRNGYYIIMGLMGVLAIFLVGYFRRKRWL